MTPLSSKDTLLCPHGGKVVLQSNKGQSLEFTQGAKAITQQDLLHSAIIACKRSVAGVLVPCTQVVSVEDGACSCMLCIQEDKIVLCENISSVKTDKGFSLSLQGTAFLKDKVQID